jgi:hypothetical protein
VFYSAKLFSDIFWGALFASVLYVVYRYRAAKIAKKKATESARISTITKNIDSVQSNMDKNEKHRKAAAVAEADRRAAAAAVLAAKAKAEEMERIEIAKSKERVKTMRAEVWKNVSSSFKVVLFVEALVQSL